MKRTWALAVAAAGALLLGGVSGASAHSDRNRAGGLAYIDYARPYPARWVDRDDRYRDDSRYRYGDRYRDDDRYRRGDRDDWRYYRNRRDEREERAERREPERWRLERAREERRERERERRRWERQHHRWFE